MHYGCPIYLWKHLWKHDPNAGDWYLFSPDDAPDLDIVYGDEYRNLYKKYVNEKRYRRCVKAKTIIDEAFISWSQIGVPYVLYKDAINLKSNMSNVAPVCSSNLCTEITIPSWNDIDRERFARFNENNIKGGEYGVCNLSAICLENFIVKNKMTGYEHLYFAAITDAAALEVYALNNMINITQYPTEECRRSNRRHRPIGIGIMGLADVLARLEIPYGSIEAQNLARAIAAVIYYGSMRASNELAKIYGAYESFPGSQLSRGEFQPDLWIKTGHLNNDWESDIEILTSGFITKKDWLNLRIQVIIQGVYNALLTAYMPTATTSNIIGQNECFEPFTSNIYTRKTLAGEFMIVNRHLIRKLVELNLWDQNMRRQIISAGGSIKNITVIPERIRFLFRTARELHVCEIILMAKAMAPFVCQSMSMSLFLDEPNLPKILRFLIEGWKTGLETGMYYLHTKPAIGSQMTSIIDNKCDRNNCQSCAV